MTVLSIDATTRAGEFSVHAAFDAAVGVTALFGPSGSGKSVILDTISGLRRPSEGTVAFDGQVVADPRNGVHVPTQHRRVGMVFQHGALLPHRTPLDNVALAIHDDVDRRTRRAKARGWLEHVNAGELETARTTTLSGGEQQRVSLARALAGSPRLLLLDEPFSALDQATRGALRRLVRRIVDEQQIPAIIVTHDLDDIRALADVVVLIEPGRTTGTHRLDRGNSDQLAAVLGLGPAE